MTGTMEALEGLKVTPQYHPDAIRKTHLNRLADNVYLDHAASALYSNEQIVKVMDELCTNLLGNPHSRNGPSDVTTQIIHSVRQRVLKHFNTSDEEYCVIFTSGATAAIKIVADNFNWCNKDQHDQLPSITSTTNSKFLYTKENHTSVLGIRACAEKAKVTVEGISSNDVSLIINKRPLMQPEMEASRNDRVCCNSLFAFSAQCNYSGVKYPLTWINTVQEHGLNDRSNWYILLDAASYVATSPLDLSTWKPDFVPVSFYKIFGYPTGLGCLLVHRRAQHLLEKTYFGGGTVELADTHSMYTVLRKTLYERFEDGTLPFLSILSLRHGFDTLEKLCGSMKAVSEHVHHLARYLHHSLRSYRHSNGAKIVALYSPYEVWTEDNHGPIVNFNILTDSGDFVGYTHVEYVASVYNIHLRTGCVCNPGACQMYLGITSDILKQQHQFGHVCGDSLDIIDGRPTGSVRVSFGYSSTYEDADRLLKMIRESFVSGNLIVDISWMAKENWKVKNGPSKPKECILSNNIQDNKRNNDLVKSSTTKNGSDTTTVNNEVCTLEDIQIYSSLDPTVDISVLPRKILTLTDIRVYPIKSCAPLCPSTWPLGHAGLLYDRNWMIINKAGYIITQKRIPTLTLVRPSIDIAKKLLTLSYPDVNSVTIPLDGGSSAQDIGLPCTARVCGDKVTASDCGDKVALWLTKVLGMKDLRLVQQTGQRKKKNSQNGGTEDGSPQELLSFANDSQVLLLHRPSVRHLSIKVDQAARESTHYTEDDLVERFRGNIILDGGDAYEEDRWRELKSNHLQFKVSGPCQRCQMVSVVPGSGQRTLEPLVTLNEVRGSNATFGVHASIQSTVNETPLQELNEDGEETDTYKGQEMSEEISQSDVMKGAVVRVGMKFVTSYKS